jgi:hypothetical protein
MRNFYLLGVLLCMLISSRAQADELLSKEKPTVNPTPRLALSAPSFYSGAPRYYVYETDIWFYGYQSNGVGVTEVYRSKFEEDNWVLVSTFTGSQGLVEDNDLSPRTSYKYRMRVVHGSEISPWSEIMGTLTNSVYYAPTVVNTSSLYSDIVLTITDNTYYDEYYDIYRIDANGTTLLQTIELLDSGQVFQVSDAIDDPAATITYRIDANAIVEEDVNRHYDHVLQTTFPVLHIYNAEEEEYVCGSLNRMYFEIYGEYDGNIEVYRSLNDDGPYSLIATLPLYYWGFTDDVAPRAGYYYKIRINYNGRYSDYSNVLYLESDSDWYTPGFEATLNGAGVEIKITDNSYQDAAYRLIRDDLPDYLLPGIVMPDSGSVLIFNDTTVLPGTTYNYHLEATTNTYCDEWPYEDAVVHATITTPPIPDYTIASFTLVDPVNDTDWGPLENGQKITITAPHFFNIRANTDAKTKSVMFFLNNKRRSDNGGPIFSYFPEKNGDYADGLMHQGVYVLEATPYSEKNGKGIKGETVVIEFEVLGPDADYTIKSLALVDPVTDQDIGPLVDGAVVDVSLAANIRAYTDSKTKAVMFFLNNKRRADNGAPVFSYFPETNGDFAPGLTVTGHYVLEATPSSEKNSEGIVGETVTIEFDVVCSGCDADQARVARVGEVSFFPNPVVATSQLKIQTLPGNEVRIQVVDQLGQARASAITLVADESGALTHPVSGMNLNKGIYLLRVDVNGAQVTKRFSVE